MMNPDSTAFSIEIIGVRDGMRATLTFGKDEVMPLERKDDGRKTLTLSLYLDVNNPGGFGDSQAALSIVNVSGCTTLGEVIRWSIRDAHDNNRVGESPRSTHVCGAVKLTSEQIVELAHREGYIHQHVMLLKY